MNLFCNLDDVDSISFADMCQLNSLSLLYSASRIGIP